MDLFDDINIDDVTVSDTYSLDMPLSLMASHIASHSQQRQNRQSKQNNKETDRQDKIITDV